MSFMYREAKIVIGLMSRSIIVSTTFCEKRKFAPKRRMIVKKNCFIYPYFVRKICDIAQKSTSKKTLHILRYFDQILCVQFHGPISIFLDCKGKVFIEILRFVTDLFIVLRRFIFTLAHLMFYILES